MLELNPSAQCCQPSFLLGFLIFIGLTGRHLSKSFGVQGLNPFNAGIKSLRATLPAEIFYFYFLKGSVHDVFISLSALKV
jgi:hypothetical protein